jgi:hypothetical protein
MDSVRKRYGSWRGAKVTVTLKVTVTCVQGQELLRREVESTDRAIDRLVYELYGLSEEEIRIVEGN